MDKGQNIIIGYISGTFYLFHIGHLNIIKRAKARCDYLIVGVHETADFKGGSTFIPYRERAEIIRACRYVDKVVKASDEDTDDWEKYHFSKLFVGSDYLGSERFKRYTEFFRDKDVEIVYLPYTRHTSSTKLRRLIENSIKK